MKVSKEVQESNEEEFDLKLIDFEYSAYNYRWVIVHILCTFHTIQLACGLLYNMGILLKQEQDPFFPIQTA